MHGQPFGHLLLAALAIGFGGYALWRLTLATVGGSTRGGSDTKTKRPGALINGVLYGAFCVNTIALAAGSSGVAGGDKAKVDWTANMKHSFGRSIVDLVGAAVIVTGAVLVWPALAGNGTSTYSPSAAPPGKGSRPSPRSA